MKKKAKQDDVEICVTAFKELINEAVNSIKNGETVKEELNQSKCIGFQIVACLKRTIGYL